MLFTYCVFNQFIYSLLNQDYVSNLDIKNALIVNYSLKDSFGLWEFYLTINEDVCAVALCKQSRNAVAWIAWQKTCSVDCSKIVVIPKLRDWFFGYFFIKKTAPAINEAKKTINNSELKVMVFRSFGMGGNPKESWFEFQINSKNRIWAYFRLLWILHNLQSNV